ncbi:DUF3597 family protein [Altererythrobacter xixiisoli]|uniref:DUF3597 family protein n=1 Tax=Croceibacterium xixiisoli TaxID=1476466 RepID=A0A6I4TV22_9SPHN|nr:DUF3597 domain-containing protein [Croceibacterium xixiisoli]MXO99814.1 DUF3597 family protein [Croceibacterium xixiisoli]
MSIFGKIKDKIFGRASSAPTPAPAAPATAPAAQPAATPAPSGATIGSIVSETLNKTFNPAPVSEVDVVANLEGIAAEKNSSLNWRTSIVDLLKLLDIDSSLQNREELARELGYTGALGGSAEMNIWLHKAVMRKLAQNGGRVPADLVD